MTGVQTCALPICVGWNNMNISTVTIRVEDWNGNVATASIPAAAHADVALGDNFQAPGQVYSLAVAFASVQQNNPFILQSVHFYNIVGAGTPSISIVFHALLPLNAPTPQNICSNPQGGFYDLERFPHIDVIPRPGAGPKGLPLMEQFVVTYDDLALAVSDVYYRTGSMTLGASGPGIFLSDGSDPDVAGQYDIAQNKPLAHFIFNLGNKLFERSLDLSTGTLSAPLQLDAITPNTAAPILRCVFFPRIEAMNIWYKKQNVMQWQGIGVKSLVATPFYSVVKPMGYNPLTPPTDLYDPLMVPPLFYALPNNSINVKSPCVSAGCGPGNPYSGEIGNKYYTVGYYPWATDYSMYARLVDPYTGIVDPAYYQINQNPIDHNNYAEADASKSLSISTCSNTGEGQYAAWYDGLTDVWDKTNLTSMVQFKTTDVSALSTAAGDDRPYPNPIREELHIPGTGTYKLYDVKGSLQLQGSLTGREEVISTSSLPPGVYMLQVTDEVGQHSYKINKQ